MKGHLTIVNQNRIIEKTLSKNSKKVVKEREILPGVREPFFLAPRPKDPGPNTYGLVNWAWFTAANRLFTNQVVHRARILQHVYTSKQEYIY